MLVLRLDLFENAMGENATVLSWIMRHTDAPVVL